MMRRTPRGSATESASEAKARPHRRHAPIVGLASASALKVAMAPVYRAFLALFIAFTLGGSAVAAQSATSTIAGAVTVPAPDGQPFVVPGVTLTLTCGVGLPRREVSNERGEFQFADVPAGACILT